MSNPTPISDAIRDYVHAAIATMMVTVQAGSYPGRVQVRRIERYQEMRDKKFEAMQKALGEGPDNDAG